MSEQEYFYNIESYVFENPMINRVNMNSKCLRKISGVLMVKARLKHISWHLLNNMADKNHLPSKMQNKNVQVQA